MSTRIVEIPQNSAASYVDIVKGLGRNSDEAYKIVLSGSYVSGSDGPQGIELLKWLRVCGIYNHCILYSSRSLAEIIHDDPKHAIIASKGTTFVDLSAGSGPQIDANTRLELADPVQLKELFRIDIDLKAIRHDEANIYGLLQLRKHHEEIEPTDEFCDLQSSEDITHEIVRFVFGSGANWHPSLQQKTVAKRQLSLLRTLSNKTIIFVDDKADTGWGNLLRVILGNCTFHQIIPTASSTALALSNEVLKLITSGGRSWSDFVNSNHLYISDLKLLLAEREITDYKKLLSYKTVVKLRTGPNYTVDDRLRVMYFTASNDLSKVKGLLDNRDFNPHLIFTKEGADQLLTAEQSFDKYLELLRSLYTLLAPKPKKKMIENLQILNLDEEEKKQKLADRLNRLYSDRVNGDVQITLRGTINEASEIYIDTNIFLEDNSAPPLIELLVAHRHKIRIAITVRHELRCIGKNPLEKRGTEEINAAFFGNLINELNVTVVNDQLSTEQNRIIQSDLCSYDWDFADDHLVELMKLVHVKTILLTNDKKFTDRVNLLSNTSVQIARNIMHDLDRKASSNRGTESIRGNRNLNQGPKATVISFAVEDIQLSKTLKSYNFHRSGDPKPVLSIKTTDLPDISTDELKAKLVGKTLNSTSKPSDIRKLLNS